MPTNAGGCGEKSSYFALLGAVAIDTQAVALETPNYRMGVRVSDRRDVHLRGYCPVHHYLPQGPPR